MSSGEVLKADKDFTKEADAIIPEAEKLGAVREIYDNQGIELTCAAEQRPSRNRPAAHA